MLNLTVGHHSSSDKERWHTLEFDLQSTLTIFMIM